MEGYARGLRCAREGKPKTDPGSILSMPSGATFFDLRIAELETGMHAGYFYAPTESLANGCRKIVRRCKLAVYDERSVGWL